MLFTRRKKRFICGIFMYSSLRQLSKWIICNDQWRFDDIFLIYFLITLSMVVENKTILHLTQWFSRLIYLISRKSTVIIHIPAPPFLRYFSSSQHMVNVPTYSMSVNGEFADVEGYMLIKFLIYNHFLATDGELGIV